MVTAVKFDGANDYLTRGGDLTGIADGKSGIFSAWVRFDSTGSDAFILSNFGGYIRVRLLANGKVEILAYTSSSVEVIRLQTTTTFSVSPLYIHVLASWDAASSAAHMYVLDVSSASIVSQSNNTIDYATASPNWSIGAATSGAQKFNGALSELYFAPNQYLDFSVEANRRKFIDADGKPVSLGATGETPTGTAPAIYLKGDNTAFGVNSGTGGNFTVNGSLEIASSTPADAFVNAVSFDGTADYLVRGGALTGVPAGKSGTVSFWFKRGDNLIDNNVLSIVSGSTERFHIGFGAGWNGLSIFGYTSAGANNFSLIASNTGGVGPSADWHHAMASWDISPGNTSKMHLYIDGVNRAQLYTPTNSNIDYAPVTSPNCYIGQAVGTNIKYKGGIAELYFAPNQYLDLSVQANREKFIKDGKPVSLGANGELPTGTAPAIYLNKRAALVGSNAGTGGNFTINGAPKDANSTPLYYYAEPVKFDGSTAYLVRGSDLTGIADGYYGTVSFWLRHDVLNTSGAYLLSNFGNAFAVTITSDGKLRITCPEATFANYIQQETASAIPVGAVWHHVLASWSLNATPGSRVMKMYLDNQDVTNIISNVGSSGVLIDYVTGTPNWAIAATTVGGNKFNGALADLWFNTTYLDLSIAANRAKFIDQTTLRPVPLGAKGELPTGSQPLLYLGRDAANWGSNIGSGGNFT